ncbi:hypothetical protein PIB30_060625 [Stylosanthes scabra]|uniref:Uncharacterized protein n=1 Tax=Stylosanthes scabra TaxID=79078 RepID=A0ABU6YLB2_9FABA|nr:hypothetical protein [Stylosanthes scabra]
MPLKDSTETKMGCQERRGGKEDSFRGAASVWLASCYWLDLSFTKQLCYSGQTKKKKTRGHTTCANIYNRTMEELEEVIFYIGGPIGPTHQSVSNITSFVGTIGRNKRFTKFILPASAEKWVIQTIQDAWKMFKAKIKLRHFVPYDNIEDMVKNRPLQVPEDHFIKLILYWIIPPSRQLVKGTRKIRNNRNFHIRWGLSISQEYEQHCGSQREEMRTKEV